MSAGGKSGSIVSLICDSGERYAHTYYDDDWLAGQDIGIGPYLPVVERAWDDKVWACP